MASITINVGGQVTSYYISEEHAGTYLRHLEKNTGAMAEDITPLLAVLPPVESDFALFDMGSDEDEDWDDEDYDDDYYI
jgi:hypothetical protein